MKAKKTKPEDSGPLKEKECETEKWLFVVNSTFLEDNDGKDASIVKLKHPLTDHPSLFLFSGNNTTVQEIQTFSEDKRSWFFGNTIIVGGKMYLLTPVDPLFLILPYLRAASQCSPLDQIVIDRTYSETGRLLTCNGLKYINQIADRRGEESLNAYIYNEEKTLNWLKKKAERIVRTLKSRGINVLDSSAVSANFVKSSAVVESRDSYLKYAHGIISEYLPLDLSLALAKYLQLPDKIEEHHKRKKDVQVVIDDDDDVEQDNKRIKHDETPSKQLLKTPKPEKQPLSAKDKARAKSATGTKNISCFFKKV